MRIRSLLLALAATLFLAGSLAAQEQQFASLGDFPLENGQVIKNLQVGYRTLGQLNASKSNAVLFPTWFTGTTKDILDSIGPGKLVDSSRYYVILVDALGNGVTSSPSNSTEQPHMQFPRFSIVDMVKAEHELATRVLKLEHVHAVIGVSMGGMQTFQWMVSYPDFMDKAIPIMGTPRQTSRDLLLWTAEIHAIEADPAWNHGNYTSPPPAGMKTVADIHYLALTTPQYIVEHIPPKDFPAYLRKIQQDTIKGFDANNWIRQAQAMIDMDVSKPFGESMEKAAATVQAQVLVIAGIHDHMVNPTPGLHFAGLLVAPTLPLTSDCGHLSSGCEAAKVDATVARFLEK